MTEHTKREFLAGIAAAPAFIANPLSRPGAEKLSPLATAQEIEQAKLYSDDPSWCVKLDGEASSWEALSNWEDEQDSNQVLAEVRTLDWAFVRAPREQAGAAVGLLAREGGGLAAKNWVEAIDLNLELTLAEPVRRGPLLDEDGQGLQAEATWWQQVYLKGEGASAPSTDTGGLARGEDVSPRPVADAHRTLESDGQSQAAGGSVDTSTLTIGVIDTGCNVDGNAISEARVLGSSADYTSDGNPTVTDEGVGAVEDGNAHGSWVASAIGSNPSSVPDSAIGNNVTGYRGPVPNADLWIGKALDDDGSGSTESIAAAVGGAVDAGVDWVCMSLGSPLYTQAIADAVQQAAEAGIGVVVATGNDRFGTIWIATPASVEDAIGIHATTAAPSDPESVVPAWFANPGPHPGTTDLSGGETSGAVPAFATPGMDLEALTPTTTGATGTETMSGTSMAAPCAVGVAALVQAATDLSDPMEVWTRLEETAYRPPALAAVEGSGLPSAKRAIAETTTDQTQGEAMNETAAARDAWYRSVSAAEGGWLPF